MDDYCAPIAEEWIYEGSFKLGSGYQAAKKLLAEKKGIEAIFCVNDVMALGAMNAIQEEGLKIPEDIAVVGFDDIELAALSKPSLSTVAQPKYESGKIAAELLFKQIEGAQSPGKYYSIEPNLVVRQSTLKVTQINTS